MHLSALMLDGGAGVGATRPVFVVMPTSRRVTAAVSHRTARRRSLRSDESSRASPTPAPPPVSYWLECPVEYADRGPGQTDQWPPPHRCQEQHERQARTHGRED